MERTRGSGTRHDTGDDSPSDETGSQSSSGGSRLPGDDARSEPITSDETRKILQRAAELSRQTASRIDEPSLDLKEVERIGVESGLSREAIQRAFVELRTGGLEPAPKGSLLDKLLGPERISAQTSSPLLPEEARRRLASILKEQLLHAEEREGNRTTWTPTPGLWASIERGLNWQGHSGWRRGRVITEVTSAPGGLDVRSLVKVQAEPGSRNSQLFGAIAPLVVTFPFIVGLSLLNPVAVQQHVPHVLAAVGLGISSIVFGVIRHNYQQQLKGMRLAVKRVMDKFSGDDET